MTRIATAAALAFALGYPTLLATPAAAQIPPELTNDMIEIEYNRPRSAKYLPLYRRLQERKLLERLAAFLSPLNLEGGLLLSLEEGDPNVCGDNPNSYYSAGTLHLCYSWFHYVDTQVAVPGKREPNEPFNATSGGLIPGFTRPEVIIGGAVGVMLHELGHALFDVQDLPLFGREEDAADQIAGLMMLQFGPKVALTTIKGTYNVWHHLNAERLRRNKEGKVSTHEEADEHSISIQRAWNFLCLAYGKDADAFGDLATTLLPPARRQHCADEYKQVAHAFRKTILPKLDEAKMKKVLELEILQPGDFRD
jgi:hypothetical protein